MSIALYPVIVYFGLQILPPSFFGIALLVLLGLRFGVLLPEERPVLIPVLGTFVVYAVTASVLGSQRMLLFYPVLVSATLCAVFLNSLRHEEPLLLRLLKARGVPLSKYAPRYLYRLTIAWAVFFVVNGSIATWTTTQSLETWTLYNGFLSYCFVAAFAGFEFLFRRWYKRRMGVPT
jgi:uncharacterized membrane protein